jgi:hypothetical protein
MSSAILIAAAVRGSARGAAHRAPASGRNRARISSSETRTSARCRRRPRERVGAPAHRLRESLQEVRPAGERADEAHRQPREMARGQPPRGEVLPLKEEAVALVDGAHAARIEARADRRAVLVMDDARGHVHDAPAALAGAPGEVDVLPVEGSVERIETAERDPERPVEGGGPAAGEEHLRRPAPVGARRDGGARRHPARGRSCRRAPAGSRTP